MTRKLIYTLDVVGEYTIGEESDDYVTIVGQMESEQDAKLFCAAPELLEALTHGQSMNMAEILDWVADRLQYVYHENGNADYIISLRERASLARAAIAKALGETK